MQELRPGQILAGYEILNHVTSGGMASLYLARRRGAAGFSKLVAIKVVHPHLAKEGKFVRMFLDEARLAARIQHPSVVSVEELLEDSGTYLMVMEFVHGCSLFQLIRKLASQGRRLSVDLTAWIAAQVADGLHAAHELRDDSAELLNVVHRDVSPQNILLSFAGHVKVIDFGIAKSRAQSDATRAGVLRGKVGYMSPEQANGLKLDRRTDIYALGIVMWECLTSRRLFRAENEILQLDMVRAPKVLAPSEYAPVPEALEEAVMDALRTDPEQRIATSKAFRDRILAARPQVGALHSSELAGLLETVMAEEIADSSALWEGLADSVERVTASDKFLENHTMAAPAAEFASDSDSDPIANEPSLQLNSADLLLQGVSPARELATSFAPPPPDVRDLPQLMPEPPARPAPPPPPPSKSVRFLTTALSMFVFVVAISLAGWLAWNELIPHEWFENAPADAVEGETPPSQ